MNIIKKEDVNKKYEASHLVKNLSLHSGLEQSFFKTLGEEERIRTEK